MAEPVSPAHLPRDIPPLTGIRGLAALSVLGFHLHVVLGPLPVFARGFLGVDVFFVLSGFLLAWLAAGDPGWRPAGFYRRRLLRVLPPLYVQMVLLGLAAAAGAAWLVPWTGFTAWMLQFTLAFHIGSDALQPAVGPWWSIPVELGFYALFPLALAGLRRSPVATVLVVAGMVLSYRAWMVQQHGTAPNLPFWLNHVPGMFDQFVFGMAAALWAFRRAGKPVAPHDRLLLPIGLVLAAVALGWPGLSQAQVRWPGAMFLHALFGLGMALALAGITLRPGFPGRVLALAPLRALGTVSYSLYLWHVPVILWIRHAWPANGEPIARQLATVVLAIVLAALAWWLVERPVQAWSRRRWPDTRPLLQPTIRSP